MTHARTVSELLSTHDPAGAAINAPGRDALTFDGLRAQIERTGETLNGFGLGREDPIAIVLPNGPEMATAFLGVASAATAAPLNPGYRAEEFDFYLSDLEARAVLVQRGDSSPVLDVAAKRGIPIVELTPSTDRPAGEFTLEADISGAAERPGTAEADDVALVLHTSGTTSRPKIVPLRQRNVCASAAHIRETLSLTLTTAASTSCRSSTSTA